MLDNAIQHSWKLVVERLYHIVPWLGMRINFAEGGEDAAKCEPSFRCNPRALIGQ